MARNGAGSNEAQHTGHADQQRVAGHRACEPDPGKNHAAEAGLQQERREASRGIEEAEETHERLALSQPRDDFRLEQVIHQRSERRGESDHEGEFTKQWHAPDLGRSAPALLLDRRWSTPRRYSATDDR